MHLKLSLVSSSLVVMAIADVPGSGSEWSVGGQTYSSRAKAQTAACSLQMVCQRYFLTISCRWLQLTPQEKCKNWANAFKSLETSVSLSC